MAIFVERHLHAYKVSEEHYDPSKDITLPHRDELLIQFKALKTTVNHFYLDDFPQHSTQTLETPVNSSFMFRRQVLSRKKDAEMKIIGMLCIVGILDPWDIPSPLIECIYDTVSVALNTSDRKVVVEVAFATVHHNFYYSDLDEILALSMQESGGMTIPATKSSIEALEKVILEGADTCVVCLEELLIGSEVRRMPCSHTFHEDCIVRWLETSHLCPLCRFKMPIF